jgi:hypothetical protein
MKMGRGEVEGDERRREVVREAADASRGEDADVGEGERGGRDDCEGVEGRQLERMRPGKAVRKSRLSLSPETVMQRTVSFRKRLREGIASTGMRKLRCVRVGAREA